MTAFEGFLFFLIVCGGTYAAMWVDEQIHRARDTLARVRQLLDEQVDDDEAEFIASHGRPAPRGWVA